MNIWIGFAWSNAEKMPPVFRWESFRGAVELWILRQRDYHGRESHIITNRIAYVRSLIREPTTDERLRIACKRFMEHYEKYLKPKR
jgi:hypothetical protein